MERDYLLRHWYADIYEQQVIQADEVEYIKSTVGYTPQNILEVACSGGRITVPLAQAGHRVTGFDFDEFMLAKLAIKASGLRNLTFYKADAVWSHWGSGYDVMVLAGNVLLNIESIMDYRQAQELFIKRAADCVLPGGHMFLDFDCFHRGDESSDPERERVCFEGADSLGTYGKYIIGGGEYSGQTQIGKGYRRYEIAPVGEEAFEERRISIKHFPTYAQVLQWMHTYGWDVEAVYGGYEKQPMNEEVVGNRAVIWAKKTGN